LIINYFKQRLDTEQPTWKSGNIFDEQVFFDKYPFMEGKGFLFINSQPAWW